MKITILAFLQNAWFPAGTAPDHIHMYRTKQDFHKKLLSQTMSGQRLLNSFGQEFFNRIWWDNASPEVTDDPKGRLPADMKHIESMIDVLRPELILAFGKIASEALEKSAGGIKRKLMHCHHPNARFRTQAELDQFAQQVFDWVSTHERLDEFTKDDES